MKKAIYLIILIIISSSVLAIKCTNYVGQSIVLPQIKTNVVSDTNTNDGNATYVYGTYKIQNINQQLTQINSNTYPLTSVRYMFTKQGTFDYTVAVAYSQIKYLDNKWQMMQTKISNSYQKQYVVCNRLQYLFNR